MKKIVKVILGAVAVVFVIIVVFWVSIVYVSDYKVTTVDTSVSPDETYELVLQAVGEADFPFGSASGRLILYKGKSKISEADFELFDDGGCMRSSIWEVTWHEDLVKVILSRDEQFDEQITLYFDGKKERKQLTDWDRYGETWSWDVSEGGEINPRTAFADKADDSHEDREPDEEDADDDIVIIINYITGAGPQGVIPRPAVRIYLAGEN